MQVSWTDIDPIIEFFVLRAALLTSLTVVPH